MALLNDDAKMPSLRDKLQAQAEEAEKLREKEEKKDEKKAKVIKKLTAKKK